MGNYIYDMIRSERLKDIWGNKLKKYENYNEAEDGYHSAMDDVIDSFVNDELRNEHSNYLFDASVGYIYRAISEVYKIGFNDGMSSVVYAENGNCEKNIEGLDAAVFSDMECIDCREVFYEALRKIDEWCGMDVERNWKLKNSLRDAVMALYREEREIVYQLAFVDGRELGRFVIGLE